MSVLLVELEAMEGLADMEPLPRQGAKPLMPLIWLQDVCWCFPEGFLRCLPWYASYEDLVESRTSWYKQSPC